MRPDPRSARSTAWHSLLEALAPPTDRPTAQAGQGASGCFTMREYPLTPSVLGVPEHPHWQENTS